MIANVINTFGSKLLIALISFLTLILNARYLGQEGLGTVGLIILNITIIVLLGNLVHGSVIYYSSRLNSANLALVSYLWTGVSLAVYFLINLIRPLVDDEWQLHIYPLAFLQASASIHFYLLLGKEKIKLYNQLTLLQSIVTIAFILISYLALKKAEAIYFVYALYAAYGLVWLLSIWASRKMLFGIDISALKNTFKLCLNYGFYVQAANTFQLLNYRISYFFLDTFSGRIALGHYTAGVQLSEALLIPGRSISTVQYARISKKSQDSYAQRVTFFFMKLSLFITIAGVGAVLLLPTSFFTGILSDDFYMVKSIILYMSIGIIALSAEIVLSHYFSGTGRIKTNLASAVVGFIATIAGCLTLVQTYGAVGAALTTAISYSSMFLFLFIFMNRQKEVKLIYFLPNLKDWFLLKRLWRRFRLK